MSPIIRSVDLYLKYVGQFTCYQNHNFGYATFPLKFIIPIDEPKFLFFTGDTVKSQCSRLIFHPPVQSC